MREEPAQGCTGGGGERSPGAQGVPRLPRGTTGDEERIREGGTGGSEARGWAEGEGQLGAPGGGQEE